MKHCNVRGDGEECADEEVVDEDGDFFNKAEHVLNRVKILIIVGKDFTYTFNDVSHSSGDYSSILHKTNQKFIMLFVVHN